jgi:hypothetical protein
VAAAVHFRPRTTGRPQRRDSHARHSYAAWSRPRRPHHGAVRGVHPARRTKTAYPNAKSSAAPSATSPARPTTQTSPNGPSLNEDLRRRGLDGLCDHRTTARGVSERPRPSRGRDARGPGSRPDCTSPGHQTSAAITQRARRNQPQPVTVTSTPASGRPALLIRGKRTFEDRDRRDRR